ncbi:penicillin acylase family protein [bacterium]|nr:penicillin acylase family protein [bacterium]
MSTISRSARVDWVENGLVRVDAESMSDAIVGLGYGMGRSRAWQLVLWRQAALGNLSKWFGDDAVPIDHLSLQLNLADQAKSDFQNLSESDQESVRLLTSGINEAISASDVARGTSFLLLGVEPEPWEAWHGLAIERLFSWIAGQPFALTDTSYAAGADRALREILQMDGFQYNWLASSAGDSTSFVAARYVTGKTAIPFFVETQINTPDRLILGLFVPGTFVSPMGFTSAPTSDESSLSWAFLLKGSASLSHERVDPGRISTSFKRITTDNQESLVQIHRMDNEMPLVYSVRDVGAEPVPVLTWPAFSLPSDYPSWIGLLRGVKAEPALILSDGIVMEGGVSFVSGSPLVQVRNENGILFVASALSDKTPEFGVNRFAASVSPEQLLSNTFSQSAAQTLSSYLVHLPDSLLTGARLKEGIPYLVNWNFEYDASEIGASIFEMMQQEQIRADSTLPSQMTVLLDNMILENGPDMSSWRWENIQDRTLHFPGTTMNPPDGGRPEASFSAKFHPINVGGPGHPQTFVWGTAHEINSDSLSSAWEGAIDLNEQELLFRRPFINYAAFLGSFLSSDRPIELIRFSTTPSSLSTLLLPLSENE